MFQRLKIVLIVAFLLASLAFNFALVTSKAIFTAASSAIEVVTGNRTPLLRSIEDTAELSTDLDAQRRINRQLRSDLADAQAELVIERQVKREIRSELAETSAELFAVQASRAKIRSSVSTVSERVSKRAARSAKRELVVSAGEAIPFWGVAAIVAATTLELADLCQTSKDMNELSVLFDPSSALPESSLTACGFEVPSKSKLMTSALNTPEQVWAATRDAIPDIEDVRQFEIPESMFSDFKSAVGEKTSSVAGSVSESTSEKWDQIKGWWSN